MNEDQQATTISPQIKQTLQALDELNAQLGIIGALVVEHYQHQKQISAAHNPPTYPPSGYPNNHQYTPSMQAQPQQTYSPTQYYPNQRK